jgi:hypothetical protein
LSALTSSELEAFIQSLKGDHSELDARLDLLAHTVASKNPRVTLRVHYPKFRDGNPTIGELIDAVSLKIVPFCLSRKAVLDAQKKWATLTAAKLQESANQLYQRALELFKKASKKTNRNGEFGELIVYLLIEHVLNAPQVVAKMNLKTSSQMPVHGSDGIHLSYDDKSKKLTLFWGESKCYQSIDAAIASAVESVAENLQHEKMKHELNLIADQFDWTGMPVEAREAVLKFLDPYTQSYNERMDVSVVFIAFDFGGYAAVQGASPSEVDQKFTQEISTSLQGYCDKLDAQLVKHSIGSHTLEVFFMPVPSVDDMRERFQNKIGWTA